MYGGNGIEHALQPVRVERKQFSVWKLNTGAVLDGTQTHNRQVSRPVLYQFN